MPDGSNPRRPLSDLLAGLRLAGRTWCYGDFAADAGCAIAANDGIVLHAVIHGSLRLACSSGRMEELQAGEVAFVLSGEAHALRTAPGARTQPHAALRNEHEPDIPPATLFGEGTRVTARVLSGRLRPEWPSDVSRTSLPSLLLADRSVLQANAFSLAGLGAGSTALLTRLAEALLVATLRTDPTCRRILSSERRDPVDEALQLIIAAPAQPWTVESLARAVGMGRSNFAAHFSQRIGKAPMEVVAEHRMEHAARLLREGRMKIVEIAEMAGYGSEAAFSRRFSRHFGLTPSQLREQARAEKMPSIERLTARPLLGAPRSASASQAEDTSIKSRSI